MHQQLAQDSSTGRRTENSRPPRPAHNRADAILELQRSAGNRSTTILLQRVPQPAGTITDPAELERSRPIGGAVDVETRVRIVEALLATPRSKAILDAIGKLRGDVLFPIKWSAKGNFHRSGEIHLDRRKNEPIWLASMAHEIAHLHAHLAGTSANVRTMGRDEYINTQMTEEIGAHAAAYVTQLQMGRATSSSAGYNEFRALLAKDHADLLTKKDWTAIEALAKPFVENKYKTEWVGTASGKNYYEKWGEIWDAAHPAP